MVWKFEVVWSKPTKPKAFFPPRGSAWASKPGKSGR